jgi:hypothetical protein
VPLAELQGLLHLPPAAITPGLRRAAEFRIAISVSFHKWIEWRFQVFDHDLLVHAKHTTTCVHPRFKNHLK